MKGKRRSLLSSAAFALLCASAVSASVLEWKNGEKVGGGIVTATGSVMTWRVDPARFGEPLELQMHVLRSIDLKPDANKDWSKDEATQEPFSLPPGRRHALVWHDPGDGREKHDDSRASASEPWASRAVR
jgi:hypothetical protein